MQPEKDLNNVDILVPEWYRKAFSEEFDAVFPIFDWPDHRALFLSYDNTANSSRDENKRNGVKAVLFGVTALIVALWIDKTPSPWYQILAALTVFLTLYSGFCAWRPIVAGMFGWSNKDVWLQNRLMTERLRQLYFQFIVTNAYLGLQSLEDPAAKAAFDAKRAAALTAFKERYPEEGSDALANHCADVLDKLVWVTDDLATQPSAAPTHPHAEALMAALRKQRLNAQGDYAKSKLAWSGARLQWKAKYARIALNALTLALPVVAAVSAALILFYGLDNVAAQLWTVITVVVSTIVVGLRALSDGFQWAAEAERYAWYDQAIQDIAQKLDGEDLNGRLHLLRHFEVITYQEMRLFANTQRKAHFLPA